MTRTEPALFFQISAALIPALLFAAATTKTLDPRKLENASPSQKLQVVFFATAVVVLALVAEIFALQLSFTPTGSLVKATFVVYSIAVLASLVGAVLLYPWYRLIRGTRGGALLLAGCVLYAAFFTFAAVTLNDAVGKGIVKRDLVTIRCIERWTKTNQASPLAPLEALAARLAANSDRRSEILDEAARNADDRSISPSERRAKGRHLAREFRRLLDQAERYNRQFENLLDDALVEPLTWEELVEASGC